MLLVGLPEGEVMSIFDQWFHRSNSSTGTVCHVLRGQAPYRLTHVC
jgi:hypothetical protein